MAVPKRRTSRSKSRTRRAHDAMKAPAVIDCPECGAPTLPHRVCAKCGAMSGRVVVEKEEV